VTSEPRPVAAAVRIGGRVVMKGVGFRDPSKTEAGWWYSAWMPTTPGGRPDYRLWKTGGWLWKRAVEQLMAGNREFMVA